MAKAEQIVPRDQSASQLVQDFELQRDAEYFSDPSTRVDFLQALDFNDFASITQHVNARVRGYEPRDKVTAGEKGGYLPMMRTPSAEEKPEAFRKGFAAIQEYLHGSPDSDEQKVKSAGMAVEALVVWVHPFNDGNGRTSRFMGKFIEDGTTDTEQLVKATADRNERMRRYPEYLRLDDTTDLNNEDIILDDDEIEDIRKSQQELPITDGIAQSLTRLMEDKTLQERVEADSQHNIAIRQQAILRKAAA